MASKRSFGGIRKLPSGNYQAYYTGPDTSRHVAPMTFSAKVDAEGWLASERRRIEDDPAGWQPPKLRVEAALRRRQREAARTFGRYATEWLADRPLAPRTRHEYEALLRRHVLPTFGEVPLTDIDRAAIRDWYRGTSIGAPHQRKHAYDLLRAILNTAVDDELITQNPAKIRGASAVKRTGSTEPATLDQLAVIVDATPPQYRLMVMLATWCALRRGELAELRRSDIDVRNGVVKVRRAASFVPGKTIVKGPKTEAGSRDVAIPEHLMPLVREHLLQYTEPGPDGLLFPSPRGQVLRDATLGRWFYPARQAAGRPDLRFHDLRHTGAVYAAQAGATIAELMLRLGHTTPAAAMRYQHAAAERDHQIAQRMSAIALAHAASDTPT